MYARCCKLVIWIIFLDIRIDFDFSACLDETWGFNTEQIQKKIHSSFIMYVFSEYREDSHLDSESVSLTAFLTLGGKCLPGSYNNNLWDIAEIHMYS